MVWIHGGGFILGSGTMFGEPDSFVDEDVVVVTINYRLGALGFMTFGNHEVSGNMGLKDQQMAIQWIRNNIRHFGGNPEKVTLFGESAGGISVHAQVLSPFNYGLLAGGIAQSGTMLMTPLDNHPEKMAKETAKRMECSTQLDAETLKCLQEASVEDLLINSSSESVFTGDERKESFQFLWWPVQDSYATEPFCPMKPLEALKTGRYNQVPFMSGTVKNDGALFLPINHFEDVSNDWDILGPAATMLDLSPDVSDVSQESIELSNIIKKYYTGDNLGLDNLENTMNMYTDSAFLAPDQKSVSLMCEGEAPVYNYVLSYKGSNTFKDLLREEGDETDTAPSHADDLIYLFESPLYTLESEEEQNLSKYMRGCWANFAKYGNPTPFRNQGYPTWEPFNLDKKNYMDLKPSPELKQDIAPERMMFWNRMIWAPREAAVDRLILLQKAAKIFQ
jgi:carboxylesterase type B